MLAGICVWWYQQPLRERSFGKRGMPGQHVIERAAEAVDVGPMIDRMAVERLFGGQIIGRAQHVFVVGDRQRRFVGVGELGQSQIENFDGPLQIDQQVGRLDVAMDQARFVGVLQAR